MCVCCEWSCVVGGGGGVSHSVSTGATGESHLVGLIGAEGLGRRCHCFGHSATCPSHACIRVQRQRAEEGLSHMQSPASCCLESKNGQGGLLKRNPDTACSGCHTLWPLQRQTREPLAASDTCPVSAKQQLWVICVQYMGISRSRGVARVARSCTSLLSAFWPHTCARLAADL